MILPQIFCPYYSLILISGATIILRQTDTILRLYTSQSNVLLFRMKEVIMKI